MDKIIEVGDPQNSTSATSVVIEGETVTIPKAEFDDLQHKAQVSSQNFERAKKAEGEILDLETRIADLEGQPDPSGNNDAELGRLQGQVAVLTANAAKADVLEAFPVLKEVWSDFEAFHAEDVNKAMPLMTAAKVFVNEKGLNTPTRPGAERPSGGDRTPPASGMSPDDVKNLRETDYKKYREMVKKGLIVIS